MKEKTKMNDNVTLNANIDEVLPQTAVSDKETNGEKMFTQSQLEEIISERLQRERKVNESLSTVKQVLLGASDKGIVKKGSYAEMADELVRKLKSLEEDKTSESGKMKSSEYENLQGDSSSITPPDISGGGNSDVDDDGSPDTKESENKGDDFLSVLSFLKSNYPEGILDRLLEGDLFERFAKGRGGSPREIISDFFDFASAVSCGNANSNDAGGYSSFASTAFSSKAGAVTGGEGLTPRQMEIARNSGMSYREYAQLLESIPKNKGRTF